MSLRQYLNGMGTLLCHLLPKIAQGGNLSESTVLRLYIARLLLGRCYKRLQSLSKPFRACPQPARCASVRDLERDQGASSYVPTLLLLS